MKLCLLSTVSSLFIGGTVFAGNTESFAGNKESSNWNPYKGTGLIGNKDGEVADKTGAKVEMSIKEQKPKEEKKEINGGK